MFLNTFITTCLATLQVLLMGGVGFFVVKKKVLDDKSLDRLNELLIKVLLPALIFHQITTRFDAKAFPNWWMFPLICFGVVIGGFLIGWLVLLFNRGCEKRNHFLAVAAFPNGGYIPLMMIASLFEGQAQQTLMIYLFLFLMGFDASTWSLGAWLVAGEKDGRHPLRRILTPPFVTTVSSVIFVFLGLNTFVPEILMKPIKMFGDCVLPIALIVVGGTLARIETHKVRNADIFWVVIAKLIVLPACALGALVFVEIDFLLGYFILLEFCVPTATSLSVLGRMFDVESDFINQGILVTHLVSIFTIPLFLAVYSFVKG